MVRAFPSRLLSALAILSAAALSTGAQTGTAFARYEVTFDATWSATSHPAAYPAGAHFSPLVGATHVAGHHLWEPGGIASLGIETMAETGNAGPLLSEVDAARAMGLTGNSMLGVGNPSPGQAQVSVLATRAFPYASLVTMVAPSPDWFVGVDGVQLFQNGAWVDELVVDLLVWDAGSDDGTWFTSPDANTVPKQPITLITGGPFTGNDPVGTFTFRRREAVVEYGTCANPEGSLAITGAPRLGNTIRVAVHDPGLTMPMPSLAVFVVSDAPHPSYPCGATKSNWGLAAPGATGEILTLSSFQTVNLPSWSGAPVEHAETIPNDPSLAGLVFYLQGALVAPGTRIGLTSGLAIWIDG